MVMSQNETGQIVTRLFALTRGTIVDPLIVKCWHDEIKNIDPIIARLAAKKMWSAEENRFPSISIYLKYVEAEYPNPVPILEDALDELHATLLNCGKTSTPKWSHWAIEEAINSLGGWHKVCGLSEQRFAKEFEERYRNISVRAKAENRRDILSGPVSEIGKQLAKELDADSEQSLEDETCD